jgi:hypothetical protein
MAAENATGLFPEITPGALPNLNGTGSTLIGAGDATGLFPEIAPSATPSYLQGLSPRPSAAPSRQTGRWTSPPVRRGRY